MKINVLLIVTLTLLIFSIGLAEAGEINYDLLWNFNVDNNIKSASLSPDGLYVVAMSRDVIYLFGKEGNLLWENDKLGYLSTVSLSSYGSYIATGSQDATIYFLNQYGERLWTYRPDGSVYDVSVSSNGEYIVASCLDERIYLFTNNGELIWSHMINDSILSVSTSFNGSFIAAGSQDNTVYFFNNNGELIWKYKTNSSVKDVSISLNGSYVTAVTSDDNVYFLDQKGELIWSFNLINNLNSIAVSSDGAYITIGSEFGFDQLNNKKEILWSKEINSSLSGVFVSSDASNILTVYDNKINVFANPILVSESRKEAINEAGGMVKTEEIPVSNITNIDSDVHSDISDFVPIINYYIYACVFIFSIGLIIAFIKYGIVWNKLGLKQKEKILSSEEIKQEIIDIIEDVIRNDR